MSAGTLYKDIFRHICYPTGTRNKGARVAGLALPELLPMSDVKRSMFDILMKRRFWFRAAKLSPPPN
jgi:hypothetical protein